MRHPVLKSPYRLNGLVIEIPRGLRHIGKADSKPLSCGVIAKANNSKQGLNQHDIEFVIISSHPNNAGNICLFPWTPLLKIDHFACCHCCHLLFAKCTNVTQTCCSLSYKEFSYRRLAMSR